MLVLIVEDDQGIAFLISEAIEEVDRTIEMVHNGADGINFISRQNPDLIILDYSLPDMNARELISILKKRNIPIPPFIVSTGQGDELIAVEMMKMGAHDYLVKDTTLMRRLPGIVKRAIDDISRDKVLRDAIDSKKKSDEKLLEEQRRLANIIKATRVGTWEWDIKSDAMVLNDRYANILGYALAELQPTNSYTWRNLTHPTDIDLAIIKLDDHFSNKADYFEVESRMKHKAGHWVWVLTRGCIMEYGPKEKPLLMAGTMQDISDKKLREELEKEIEVANKTLQFKQNFMASMSHEMRTPLTGIIGITEVLARTKLDTVQDEYVNILKNASESLKDIIDQVLDYSKIETGKLKLIFKPFLLGSLIDEATKVFDNVCRKPIKFETYLSEVLPEMIKADQNRLIQVVNNLIVNAVKYSEEGKIKLAVLRERIIDEHNLMVRVELSDTGIGIKPEKQKIIFSPFADVDQINTSYYEGTGLGLAISREIIEMHGGRIGVLSKPREGTTFWFTFKAKIHARESCNGYDAFGQLKQPEYKLKILFVEDKPITQKVVKLQLNDMGHQVAIASNGKEAIEKFTPELFDIVLMDIQMPVMDGITATKELKSKYPNMCPVVGLSANVFEGDREKYMGMGFDEYITKPMQKEQFVKVIIKFFGS
jgi:PAS domain S-box-containing protein